MEDKLSLYIVAIVGIVAIVALIMFITTSGNENANYYGMAAEVNNPVEETAYISDPCSDTCSRLYGMETPNYYSCTNDCE